MAQSKTVKFLGKNVAIAELSAEQLDGIIDGEEGLSKIDIAFDADMVSQKMIAVSTGISAEELRRVPISELRPLVDAIREVNKDFFLGLAKLMEKSGKTPTIRE
jgi:hypothetical protein